MSNQSDQKKLQMIKQFITPNDISFKKRTFQHKNSNNFNKNLKFKVISLTNFFLTLKS